MIAAVNSYALGGKYKVVSARNLIIVAGTASFGQSEISLTSFARHGWNSGFIRFLKHKKTKELIFLSNRIVAK